MPRSTKCWPVTRPPMRLGPSLVNAGPSSADSDLKELNRMVWRVGTHAVGDAAIDEVLAGYEAANAARSIVGKRWAIEHGFIPREEHFARIKALGLIVTVQNHLYLAGPSLIHY